MKRLFRTSKSGIDPLPPPSPSHTPVQSSPHISQQPSTHQQQWPQQHGVAETPGVGIDGQSGKDIPPKRSMASILGVTAGPASSEPHGHPHPHHDHQNRPRQGSVTPFPVDLGREAALQQHAQASPMSPAHGSVPPPPPAPHPPGHGSSAHRSSKSKERLGGGAPTLLEIQHMQAAQEERERDARRDEWLAQQRSSNQDPSKGLPLPINAAARANDHHQGTPSPDGWTIISGPQPPYPPPPKIPAAQRALPSPTNQPSSISSTPTIQQAPLYLPPGARPPSPLGQLQSSTPPRPSYPSSLGHSQSSVLSNDLEPFQPAPRAGRDRGYSSASGSMRGSDHEGSSHSHGGSKLQKPTQPHSQYHYGSRSPLSNSYASPDPNVPMDTSAQLRYPTQAFPTPQIPPPSHSISYDPMTEQMSAVRIEGPTPDADQHDAYSSGQHGGKDKEKKKFWGMNMGMSKEKTGHKKDKEKLARSHDEPRQSSDWSRQQYDGDSSVPASNHSHGPGNLVEEEHSYRAGAARMLGLDFGGGQKKEHGHAAQVDSVTSAIQMLCAQPNPPFSAIFEVCERINQSQSAEAVTKEAAQALRKQFKHGNEPERRAAANLWLIMMRNVHAKGFRAYASGKKFLGSLEPILLAPPNKALVSPATHRMIADILADIAYNFGQEKGFEGLGELWRKIKMPQEPDSGIPLPADYQAFTPENFYDSRGFDSFDSTPNSNYPSSRRPSSPNAQYLRAPPGNQPYQNSSPRMDGPGYSALPSHGDDIRRLVEESTAGKESARVLQEALVFTRPDELDSKPIIREFYRKCFLAYESLTNQIDWAQVEAGQSRERIVMAQSMYQGDSDDSHEITPEERALATLFEAHSALGEALKQHDDMERMAVDDREMREVRERSKKETRMDRSQQLGSDGRGLLAPDAGGSTSRSPSPSPHPRLPNPDRVHASPPQMDHMPLPLPISRPHQGELVRSRTPSPDRAGGNLRLPVSPQRAHSPLGQSMTALPPVGAKPMKGPRPLPNPFTRGPNGSQQSLASGIHREQGAGSNPSRSGTGSTHDGGSGGHAGADGEEDEVPLTGPVKPSRKALGKRRAIVDEDNHFDPDDMFGNGASKKSSSNSSEESVTADEVFFSKPVQYAYDAYQEKLQQESAAMASAAKGGQSGRTGGGGGGGSGSGGYNVGIASPVTAR